jgi:hypothetical protein
MTDIFDRAVRRTPLRIIGEGPLASRWRSASHVTAEAPVYEAPPSARAGAPRKWVGAALVSLLAVLLMAGAYWYVTGVHVTDDPYVNVGEGGISTDVSGITKNIDVACSSSSCVRSPRSRLSPRAIVGRPESRQGDLHLAALPLRLEACPPISMTIGGFCSWTSRAGGLRQMKQTVSDYQSTQSGSSS